MPVDWLTPATTVCLGAILGSFLNVVIHRLPQREDQQSRGNRSACPHCGAPIPIWLNIPVLAWVYLRGRAKCCGNPIHWRYPLVELLTASLIALGTFLPPFGSEAPSMLTPTYAGWIGFVVFAYFAGNLVANTFIDLEFRILPDKLTKPLMAVGLLGSALVPGMHGRVEVITDRFEPEALARLLESGLGLAVGGGLTWFIHWVSPKLFGQQGMGFGDVKLMAGIGAFVGWEGAIMTFFLASMSGALLGSLRALITNDPRIAFGPFLVVGALLSAFAFEPIHHFLFETWPTWQRESASAPFVLLGVLVLCCAAFVMLRRRRRRS